VADAMHVGLVSRTPDNLWLGWWWAEYAAALALLYFVVREAREAVEAARGATRTTTKPLAPRAILYSNPGEPWRTSAVSSGFWSRRSVFRRTLADLSGRLAVRLLTARLSVRARPSWNVRLFPRGCVRQLPGPFKADRTAIGPGQVARRSSNKPTCGAPILYTK